MRLQRILMLRDLGLGIPAIAEVLAGYADDTSALMTHLHWLQQERNRIDRQIASVENTIRDMEGGEQLMAENMFDGFDHTQYKDEVEAKWGAQAYADSNRWWSSMRATEKAEWMTQQKQLASDWSQAAAAGLDPRGAQAQALATRHADWLSGIPGTPSENGRTPCEYVEGLAEMYVADERFAANYGGLDGATFVRDAMLHYAAENL